MRFNRRSFEETAALVGTAVTLYQTGRAYYEKYQEWTSERVESNRYSISIHEGEDEFLFRRIMMWGLDQVPDVERKHITVALLGQKVREVVGNQNTAVQVELDGVPIQMIVQNPQNDPDSTSIKIKNGKMGGWEREMHLVFPSLAARTAFFPFMQSMVPDHTLEPPPPAVYRSRKTGGWSHVKALQPRSLDSLFLPEGMLEDMIEDIDRFKGAKQAYLDRGLLWHRGFLLHGPPGTGKSSTICALANHFNMNVHFLSLSEIESDSALTDCVRDVECGDLLVLEDVDVFAATHAREDKGQDGGLTLNGLLNVLDGLMTPEGLVTIMTTNHPGRLDSALTRPGRADRSFELGYMTPDQLRRMVNMFVGNGWGDELVIQRNDVAPAEIVECLKSSFDNEPEFIAQCIQEVIAPNVS